MHIVTPFTNEGRIGREVVARIVTQGRRCCGEGVYRVERLQRTSQRWRWSWIFPLATFSAFASGCGVIGGKIDAYIRALREHDVTGLTVWNPMRGY